ncbi:MAG TPA: carboxylesterase/lipase family protein [Candidatus Angelobacter sp.]|jgi:para-nitrobenzyl esterase|nr:carboxylesterase/lipase family protein [Candidatus Angelobacter sp.]
MKSHREMSRRQMMRLTAAAATAATLSSGSSFGLGQQQGATPSRRGRAEEGPGVPVVTKIVKTANGPVQGLVIDGVHSFKGLRYGAAPIGALRWMPPQKSSPWTTVQDCSDFGAPAMQMATGITVSALSDFSMQMHRVFTTPSELKIHNEDCLFLNVWTPGLDSKRRPVMVWIHGGGFAYGSGAQPIYQGEDLARSHDVVAISVNHRLNLFGYLHLGDLMGNSYASSGTVGMQDLVLALEWVRDNIAEFGGDPGNVTIMGQSGGGAKVSILLSMESAKGLFHKASIQSGAGLRAGRKESAGRIAKALLDELKIAPGDIKALQAVPAQTLIDTANALAARVPRGAGPGSGRLGGFGPILDGVAITRDPFDPDGPAISTDVPILVGSVKDEWTIFTASEAWFGTMTEADLQERLKPMGARGQSLLAAFRKIHPDYSPTYLYISVISTPAFGNSITLAERKAAQHGAPVYMWYLTWETPVNGGALKTPHTMEIPFMLHNYNRVRAFVGPGTGPDRMARQLSDAWVAFARSGKPDAASIPHWPAYDAASRATMIFNLKSEVVNDPNSEVRKILQASA